MSERSEVALLGSRDLRSAESAIRSAEVNQGRAYRALSHAGQTFSSMRPPNANEFPELNVSTLQSEAPEGEQNKPE